MSKKTNCIHAKLDDKDYELFQNNLKKTCLTAGTYIHHLIHGNRIVECPTTELLEVLRELRKISNSMLKISMLGKWNEKNRDEIRNYATLVQRIASDIITGDFDWKI